MLSDWLTDEKRRKLIEFAEGWGRIAANRWL